tara:strand:- start:448 stop:807 length:360 start_codon:yes stop_codon:yes gene_type:complete
MIDWEEQGKRIAELRAAHKLSLRQLAQRIGVSHQAIASWEKGISAPNKANVNALCDVFNVKPSFILTGLQIKDTMGQQIINQIDLLNKEDQRLIVTLIHRLMVDEKKSNGNGGNGGKIG